MLVDRTDGMPLLRPTFYLTSMVHLPGKELNTQRQVLSAIQFLYEWSRRNQIDLEERFRLGYFLELREVEMLCADIQIPFRDYIHDPFAFRETDQPAQRIKKIGRLHRPRSKTSKRFYNDHTTTSIKLSYMKNYVDWLAAETIGRSSSRSREYTSMQAARTEMIKWLKERIPSPGKSRLKIGLTPKQRTRLLAVIEPDHPENPFKGKFARERNRLLILFLDHLGLRRSEALLLKLNCIDIYPTQGSREGSVDILEHPNDPEDTRRNRPQLKTAERSLPIGSKLCRLLRDFIARHRGKLYRARRHGYLFVSRNGESLSLSSLDDIFDKLSTVEGVPDDFSSHVLRYTWNDRYSEYVESKVTSGEWTIKDEEQTRRMHQGWSLDSKMPERYSRRFLEKKSREASLHLQNDIYIMASCAMKRTGGR